MFENLSRTFARGIHPREHKETADKPIRRVPFAPVLVIPLSQHIGAPARGIVREGQEVDRGQCIAEPGGFVSVPYHAPVAGTITSLGLAPTSSGNMVQGIYLKPYAGAGQQLVPGAKLDPDSATPQQICDAVRDCGMTGLGGASFPTHIKFRIPEGKSVDSFIVNGAECEPWLTADHRIMLERAKDLFLGIRFALKATGAQRAFIGIEENKMDAVALLEKACPPGLPVSVRAVRVKYPQGAEKMLLKTLINREVPPGKLPLRVGAVVSNVATIAELGRLLPHGLGLVERVLTISGPGVINKGNYLVPIGTPLRFLLEHVGLTQTDQPPLVLQGGPMMGPAVANLDVPVTKGTSGIVVLPSEKRSQQVMPCIRCGYCVDVCPMKLNPSRLGRLAEFRDYETMRAEFNLMDCFECGSCSFICPSHIPLVHQFRVAKSVLRDLKTRISS